MAQHRFMDDQFEARLAAWLDDPAAPTAGDKFSLKADGYDIAKRAIAEANSHETCARDARKFTVLIGVAGADGEETVHEIPPETTLMCVLGALQRDPETAGMRVIGILKDDEPEEDELPTGIKVTSENPDIAVSWTLPDDAEPEPWSIVEPPAHLRPGILGRIARRFRSA